MGIAEILKAVTAWIPALWNAGRDWSDRRAVRRWLMKNTRDERGQTHAETVVIAKGCGLLEPRVHAACMQDRLVFRSKVGLWSVWRQEPHEPEYFMEVVSLGRPSYRY